MKRLLILAALIVSACSSEPQPGADAPEAYSVSLPLTPARGGGAQRITLPAAALTALRQASAGDVRVFDARGRSMAMALEGAATDPQTATSFREIAATPIRDARAIIGGEQVSVRIERDGRAVGVEAGGSRSIAPSEAVLLDTRSLDRPVDALFIRATLPRYVAATITVEASSDLKTWDLLGEKVLYRTTENSVAPEVLASSRFTLNGADLSGRYLKLSWAAAQGVEVTGARLSIPTGLRPVRVAVPTTGAVLSTPHELAFSVRFATSLAAIRVSQTAPDGPVPVTLYGRDAADQPWAVLAKAVMREGAGPAELELSGAHFATYKLVADERTSGFARAPRLDLMIEPLTIVAVFNGAPPYRLAVGNQAARERFLSVEDLAGSAERAASLPAAKVETNASLEPVDVDPTVGETERSSRELILWLALLVGTAVLALAVWRLMRSSGAASKDS